MSISHSEASGSFPVDALVQSSMTKARSRWSSKGLDADTCARLESRLNELAATPIGRFILVNGGWNGYWTNYLAEIGCDLIQNKAKPLQFTNETEEYILSEYAEVRGEHELMLRKIIGPIMKPGAVVASVPCGLMSEVLMATDHFEGIQLYAIDIDKENFDLIREKYGDRLAGNEFHPLEMDALTLDFDCKFDLITCVGFVVYIKQENFPDFLSRIHRAIKPGGRLLLSFRPDDSERSKLFPFHTTRMEAIDREFLMCVEKRNTILSATSNMLRHFSHAGFVHIRIHGGSYYQLPFIEAYKRKKEENFSIS